MDRATQERWCEALKTKGQEKVRQKLELRPGPPTELFYDIVDEPPYPDRAFCEAWCRGTPITSSGISRAGVIVLIMSVLVVVCGLRAFTSASPADANWLSQSRSSQQGPLRTPPAAPTGGPAASDTAIGYGAVMNQATQNSSVISTQEQSSILPSCTAVSNAGNTATLQKLPPCSKLGQPFAQQGSSRSGSGTPSGGASGGSSGGGVSGALGNSSSDASPSRR